MLRSGDRAELPVVETSRSSSNGAPRAVSARAADGAGPEPFAVDTQRRDHVTIVQPRGELDFASVETLSAALGAAIADTLRAALDGFERGARLVLDLRGLSFMDSAGVHLLVALDRRAKREGFDLTLVAPAAPIDRAIQLCALDQVLPFVAPDDAVDNEPAESASGLKAPIDPLSNPRLPTHDS
jgi:anti-sigma B factor antagonist